VRQDNDIASHRRTWKRHAGSIRLNGDTVWSSSPKRNTQPKSARVDGCSIVRDLAHMTVSKFAYGLRVRGVAAAETPDQRRRVLDMVQMALRGPSVVRTCPAASSKRVAVARAIAFSPPSCCR